MVWRGMKNRCLGASGTFCLLGSWAERIGTSVFCEESELVVSPDGGLLSSFHRLFAQAQLRCLWSLNSQLSYLTGSKWRRALEVGQDATVLPREPGQTKCVSSTDALYIDICSFLLKWASTVAFWRCLRACVGDGVKKGECDDFPGPVGSERRKLMEFSTSKQGLLSYQFNLARLKPTHIHQSWLDGHRDPDAHADRPAEWIVFWPPERAEVT